MNELAEKLGITMGTASIAINKLNEKQFIERIRSDEDRRKVFVKLSKKGEMALNYHGNFHSTILEKNYRKYSKRRTKGFCHNF